MFRISLNLSCPMFRISLTLSCPMFRISLTLSCSMFRISLTLPCPMFKISLTLSCPMFRISLTLSCPMNLKLYPMDRQTCALKIASCKYLLKIILFIYIFYPEVKKYLKILKIQPPPMTSNRNYST